MLLYKHKRKRLFTGGVNLFHIDTVVTQEVVFVTTGGAESFLSNSDSDVPLTSRPRCLGTRLRYCGKSETFKRLTDFTV